MVSNNPHFNFVADSVIKHKAYPALAQHQANPYTPEWREFGRHWPYTVPCELHEHCVTHNFPYHLHTTKDSFGPKNFYTIGLGFFDFSIDYFSLIPLWVFEQKYTVLFYYHEGDNPARIKKRLDQLCEVHRRPSNCYVFVSGNTSADQLDRFAWFTDHELLYWHRNQAVSATLVHDHVRPYQFTILNRTHKWWRATVMADLHRSGLLNQSQWSYNTNISVGDNPADNPIEVDALELSSTLQDFIQQGPYDCDPLTADQHNDHHLHVPEHYTQSYCHIVLETHFDADQSGGTFLTEKTFKPIKHGQPFVIIGPAGTLQALRDLGYCVFDHAIDNSYDLETNNTLRWQQVLRAITTISQQDLPAWFDLCRAGIQHNQQHFLASKYDRLNTLYDKLLHQLATP
jgi:hypothetical protein